MDDKSIDNGLPNKILDLFLGDLCKWFSFNLLYEIVDGDDQKFFLSSYYYKVAEDIDPPHGEWSRLSD